MQELGDIQPEDLGALAEMYAVESQTLIGKDPHFEFESMNLSRVCRRKRIPPPPFDGRPSNNIRASRRTVNSLGLIERSDMVMKSPRHVFKGRQSFEGYKIAT
jgi:hypothetical protein